MIEELAILIDYFPSPANQTWCFLHILNLVVKSIIQQFDLLTSKKTPDSKEDDENMGKAKKELLKLAGEIELEQEVTVSGHGGNEGDATEDDNDEGWVDEHKEMTEELLELDESVQPVRLLLTKVCVRATCKLRGDEDSRESGQSIKTNQSS